MSENPGINPNSFVTEAELNRIDYSKMDLEEEVIQLNRVAKVVKGGRRFSFSALVVVGDRKGHVGLGFGKANEVPESIQKGVQNAKKNLIRVPRVRSTIPYAINGQYRAARVMLKPASEGTGIIAGPAIRSVLELGGIKDVLTKNLGCKNVINILKAVIEGFKSMQDAEDIVRLRGKTLEETVGKRRAKAIREANVNKKRVAFAEQDAEADRFFGAVSAGGELFVTDESDDSIYDENDSSDADTDPLDD